MSERFWRLPQWIHIAVALVTRRRLFRIVLKEEWVGDQRRIIAARYKWIRL